MPDVVAFLAPLASLESHQWVGIVAAVLSVESVLGAAGVFGWWLARR